MLFYFAQALAILAEPWLEKEPAQALLTTLPIVAAIATLTSLTLRRDFLSAVLATVLSLLLTPAVFVGLVLFGGSLIENLDLTLLAAAHLSIIGLQPMIFFYGLDSAAWTQGLSLSLPFDGPYLGFLGTFIGAWLGAVPIVLDWDRDWQRYPVTIVLGAYVTSSICGFFGVMREKSEAELKLAAKYQAKAEKNSKTKQKKKTD